MRGEDWADKMYWKAEAARTESTLRFYMASKQDRDSHHFAFWRTQMALFRVTIVTALVPSTKWATQAMVELARAIRGTP